MSITILLKLRLFPLLFIMYLQVKHGLGVEEIVNHILQGWEVATGKKRH